MGDIILCYGNYGVGAKPSNQLVYNDNIMSRLIVSLGHGLPIVQVGYMTSASKRVKGMPPTHKIVVAIMTYPGIMISSM